MSEGAADHGAGKTAGENWLIHILKAPVALLNAGLMWALAVLEWRGFLS